MAVPMLFAISTAVAQAPRPSKFRRIGFLSVWPGPDKTDRNKAIEDELPFWESMRKKGWTLGDNVIAERVYAHWKVERLLGLAQELVRRRVDIILCRWTEEAMVAAARATQTIPIVFANAFLPVEQGLIDSYARPGRNLTGTAMYAVTEVTAKRLEFVRAVAPNAKRLSWLWGGDSLSFETVAGRRFDMTPTLDATTKALGFETRFHIVRSPEDIADVFGEVTDWRAQAITAGGVTLGTVQERIAEFAVRHRLPSAFSNRSYVASGGLLSYGVSDSEMESLDLRLVEYVDRILRGARPADLPVLQPSRYELVINMKTASALGLTIPQLLLARVDDVIQ
jgi:putative tryptophan/tyrosine transport system substrate-binding protein